MWGWHREGAIRAEDGEWRELVEGLDEGLWCWMEVILEEMIERSEAWVVPGSVMFEMCMVSGEGVDWDAGAWMRASSASRSMPWEARKDWAIVGCRGWLLGGWSYVSRAYGSSYQVRYGAR